MKTVDKAVIVYHPMSPWAEKADLRLYLGDTVVMRSAMRDDDAAKDFLCRRFPEIDVKVITCL